MDRNINQTIGYRISDYYISQVFNDIVVIRHGGLSGLGSLQTKNGQISLITQQQYFSIKNIEHSLFKAEIELYKYILINNQGQVLTKNSYDFIDDFEDGIAMCKRDSLWGLVNNHGKEIVEPIYTNILSLGDGFYRTIKEYQGIINKEGKVILDNNYQNIYYQKNYFIALNNDSKPLYGLYDLDGNQVIKHKYKKIRVIDSQTLLVKTRFNTFKLIDYNDKVIKHFPIKYIDIEKTNNDLWKCQLKNEHYTLIDSKNQEVIKKQYYNIRVLTSGLIVADDDIIKGDSVNHYDHVHIYKNELLNVQLSNKYALLDSNQEYLVHYCEDIVLISDYEVFIKDHNYTVYNLKTKKTSESYERLYYKSSIIFGKNMDDYYVLNDNYQNIALLDYNQFHFCDFEKQKDYLIISNHFSWCFTLIDKYGNVILDNICASYINILNDSQLIIDNYLFNIDDLEVNYAIDITDKDYSISKVLYNQNQVDSVINLVREEFTEKVNQETKILNKSKKVRKNKFKKY